MDEESRPARRERESELLGVGVDIELFSQEVPGEQHNNREKKREREKKRRGRTIVE